MVFALLMMLAFLIDQIQQLCDPLFRAVRTKLGSKRSLWEKLRSVVFTHRVRSLRHVWEALYYGFAPREPELLNSS